MTSLINPIIPRVEGHRLVVGQRVRIVRKVVRQGDLEAANRERRQPSGSPVEGYLTTGQPTMVYPHPWAGDQVGRWAVGMDRTLGCEGVVVLTAEEYVHRNPGSLSRLVALPRTDADVQVRVRGEDGINRYWWYSRLAVEYIPEETTLEEESVMSNQETNTVPPLLEGLAAARPEAPRAVPLLSPGLAAAVAGAAEAPRAVPLLSPGLAAAVARAAETPAVPPLRQGLAAAAVPDQAAQAVQTFHTGQRVGIARAVYSRHQRSYPAGHTFAMPEGGVVDNIINTNWDEGMDQLIGEEVRVVHQYPGGVLVQTSRGEYMLSPLSLEPIPEAAEAADIPSTLTTPAPQAVPTFYVGQRVRISRAAYSSHQRSFPVGHSLAIPEGGVVDDTWHSGWSRSMDGLVGEVAEVVSQTRFGVTVQTSEGMCHLAPLSLEPLPQADDGEDEVDYEVDYDAFRRFPIGQRVTIVRAVYSEEQRGDAPADAIIDPDWRDVWVGGMTRLIGSTGTVVEHSPTRNIVVSVGRGDARAYGFSPLSLAPVLEEASPAQPGAAEVGLAPPLSQGLASATPASAAPASAAPAEAPQELWQSFPMLGIVIGGAIGRDSYHVLGIAPLQSFGRSSSTMQERLVGRLAEGHEQYSRYVKALLQKEFGRGWEATTNLVYTSESELARSLSALNAVMSRTLYEQTELTAEQLRGEDPEIDTTQKLWITLIRAQLGEGGVVASASNIARLDEIIDF